LNKQKSLYVQDILRSAGCAGGLFLGRIPRQSKGKTKISSFSYIIPPAILLVLLAHQDGLWGE
jgi:hypothetical protein